MSALGAVPFHDKQYWQDRFQKETHFEWLLQWQDLKPMILPYLKNSEPILHLGCGNSMLAFDLADCGFRSVVNIDYAANVVAQMQELVRQRQNPVYDHLTWQEADCLDDLGFLLKQQPQGFAVVIDKSLSDTIACGDDDNQTCQQRLSQQIASVTRVGGVWLSISFSGERKHDCLIQGIQLWTHEKVIPIRVPQPNDKAGAPDIYYYLYVNRRKASKDFGNDDRGTIY
ncbi:uncharacterized protein BYT42DRAFT_611135 [Radiomyces spectabilis]|uniref:uncharacterized protein n=1 Tax=Radiomyces spectabilis TaxID=64574 RepID=UPI0022211C50|nr:uncharacterized protein BYT42DRAFT_611135 [Radiomyces spectabilis]KAI8388057.1 hypothetical protein BYT42DRAFT_611135 [Radiomyces spectabilis]